LNVGLTIDHPEISQIGAPETEMIDFWIGIGFLDGIFHFDHGVPPLNLLFAVQSLRSVQPLRSVQTV
jgi:hypothetical protein